MHSQKIFGYMNLQNVMQYIRSATNWEPDKNKSSG